MNSLVQRGQNNKIIVNFLWKFIKKFSKEFLPKYSYGYVLWLYFMNAWAIIVRNDVYRVSDEYNIILIDN